MSEPKHNRGFSKQDYGTPPEFLKAVKKGLNIDDFTIDLAASTKNAVAPWFYSIEDDSLKQDWDFKGWGWLNPPYSHIAPWVSKCCRSSSYIAVLVPASVGSNWWRDHVHNRAKVYFLNKRLKFVGADDVFTKDCALILYNCAAGYHIWDWTTTSHDGRL